jgi:hypothetical protein
MMGGASGHGTVVAMRRVAHRRWTTFRHATGGEGGQRWFQANMDGLEDVTSVPLTKNMLEQCWWGGSLKKG